MKIIVAIFLMIIGIMIIPFGFRTFSSSGLYIIKEIERAGYNGVKIIKYLYLSVFKIKAEIIKDVLIIKDGIIKALKYLYLHRWYAVKVIKEIIKKTTYWIFETFTYAHLYLEARFFCTIGNFWKNIYFWEPIQTINECFMANYKDLYNQTNIPCNNFFFEGNQYCSYNRILNETWCYCMWI